jgi:hypothetical protein
LKRSLARICTVKSLKLQEAEITTYCFEESKLLSILLNKHQLIKNHLATNYQKSLDPSKGST